MLCSRVDVAVVKEDADGSRGLEEISRGNEQPTGWT